MLFAALYSALRRVLELIQLERNEAAGLKAEVLAVQCKYDVEFEPELQEAGIS
jgi:hypothetical protein